jgi:protein-arginine kinase
MPLFPGGTNSLLSRHLSQDVWDACKDRTDKYGYSFKDAIFSGCKNTDSGVGVYAGSHDSYYAFAPLFDKIIEEYHGHKKTDKHIVDMDYKKLVCPKLPADEDKMILSTRVRVARNLEGYPLPPGLSREQRKEIESKVTAATSKFTGDLAGKYYSLATMTKEDQKALIADHFLFKEGDRFLAACNINKNWPEARGIYHNNDKTFLVWVNEEDQLRIISMQKGSDIGQVFERLSRASAAIEKVASFAQDDHLGYITSCPSNLGTGLRASVHIQLPKLQKHKSEMNKIASKYFVQIRGIHGEHTESDDGTYDISNLRRLGRNEVQLVQDMYNGVKAMIDAEKSL